MKKILIIEDGRAIADAMVAALQGLGEIVTCTYPSLKEVGYDFSKLMMPSKEEAIRLIGEADIILLDHKLGSKFVGEEYSGKDLLPCCAGKKVIGISGEYELGAVNFHGKNEMSNECPHVAERLREMVAKVLAE